MSLLTTVELRGSAAEARMMSVSARLEAVLADGRRLLLLDDRGWSASLGTARGAGASDVDPMQVLEPDIWAMTSAQEIAETARVVVGPDEPPAGRSQEDVEAAYWGHLAGVMRRQGVHADSGDLSGLPHDVALGERLLARLSREVDGTEQP